MRIVCPICSATYEVRDDLLVPGRTVRCSRCNEQWVPVPTPLESELSPEPEDTAFGPELEDYPDDPPAAPRLTAMDRLASHPAAAPEADRRLMFAWLISVVLLLAVVTGLIVWRDAIMHAWPPSIRLFDLLGLGPPVQ